MTHDQPQITGSDTHGEIKGDRMSDDYKNMWLEEKLMREALQAKYDDLQTRHDNICADFDLLKRKYERLTRDARKRFKDDDDYSQ